jgi:preprotein translocase subunit SecD
MKHAVPLIALALAVGCSSGSSGPPAVIKEGVRIVYRVDTGAAGSDPAARRAAHARTAEVIARRLALAGLSARATAKDPSEISTVDVDLATRDPELIEQARAIASAAGKLELALVASDAPFSKAYYRRVIEGADGQAPDPAAVAAGITAEVDSWNADGGAVQVDYYLVAADTPDATGREVLQRYIAAVSAADKALDIPVDRALHFEPLDPAPGATGARWRTYLVDPAGHVTGDQIASGALAADPAVPERKVVAITFTAAGKAALAALTRAHVGKKLAIILDGRIHSAPVIGGPIDGGKVTITLADTNPAQAADAAAQLVAILGGGPLPLPVSEAAFMQLANGDVVPSPP